MGIWTKIFKKKEKTDSSYCNHKYRDFHWYINTFYDPDYGLYPYGVKVIAHYVCVKCKDRRNEILMERNLKTSEKAFKCQAELEKKYPDHIRPQLLVEDEIKDMQLVDREYLNQVDKMIHPENYNSNFSNIFEEKMIITPTALASGKR